MNTPAAPQTATRFGRQVSLIPRELRLPQEAIRFADLRSRCPDQQLVAARRFDPYFDGLWDLGTSATWTPFDFSRRQAEAGIARPVKRLKVEPAEALDRFLHGHDRTGRLRMLAALNLWRTATAEQVMAFSGVRALDRRAMTAATLAWQAGLIDVGQFRSGVPMGLKPRSQLLRPARGKVFDEQLAPLLTWPEWVSITGGQEWSFASQYDRHNVLATELALRWFEFADVGTVLGEHLARLDNLAGSGIGRPRMVNDNRAADLVVVRDDGMRIAVELTASTGQSFTHKVRNWARLLADTPLAESGLCVVFVVAETVQQRKEEGALRRNKVAKTIAQVCREHPGQVGDRVAERMLIASWTEWFPGPRLMHPMFVNMSAIRPSGPRSAPWERVELLGPDRIGFTPWHADRLSGVLDNAEQLAGVPEWFRDRDAGVPLWPLLLAHRGLDQIPVPAPKPGRHIKDHPLGAAQGRARPIGPPQRLLGL